MLSFSNPDQEFMVVENTKMTMLQVLKCTFQSILGFCAHLTYLNHVCNAGLAFACVIETFPFAFFDSTNHTHQIVQQKISDKKSIDPLTILLFCFTSPVLKDKLSGL